jgi:two-component system, cell cycle response regulator
LRTVRPSKTGYALADAGRGAPSFAILYLDLDQFQDVKSTHGHSAEDVLLKSVAARLIGCARATDLVAHVGGARFAVLQSNLTDLADAAALASRIRDVLSTPHLLGDAEMCITSRRRTVSAVGTRAPLARNFTRQGRANWRSPTGAIA